MREHLDNEKTSKFISFQVIFYLTCVFILPIVFAVYYNFGKSAGGAIAMIFVGIFLEFVTLTMAAVLIDDKYNDTKGEKNCAIKDFIVEALFNVLLCFSIVIAKQYGIATSMLIIAMGALGIFALVTGVFLLSSKQGLERG